MKQKDKDQLIVLGFIICGIVIVVLSIYTIINTKSIDNLNARLETVEKGNSTLEDYNNQEEEMLYGYDTSEFEDILPSQIASESKGKVIVVLWARPSCSFCVQYAPIITEVAKEHNVTVRYINMETLYDLSTHQITNEKEYSILENLKGVKDFKDFAKEAIEGTPATYFIKDGKVINGIIGFTYKENVEAVFEEVGL